MAYQTPMTVKATLDQVRSGRIVLPAIQREFVWVSDTARMCRLFDSLLRKYPIGTFLYWKVPAEMSRDFQFYEVMRKWHERDAIHNTRVEVEHGRDLTAVLDGQQRLTTLNIGLRGAMASRGKYKRRSSADAYPWKYLYLDLLYEPEDSDDVMYKFAFRTVEESADPRWYRVSEILEVTSLESIFDRTPEGVDPRRALQVLGRLWSSVHSDGAITAFDESTPDLARVLDIFVRVNSGGLTLSKSDLLLSIATANFKSLDARETVHDLVDELNEIGSGFALTKDQVLKAGLMLTGTGDLAFKVENFTAKRLQQLEERWSSVASALRTAVELLSSFGFSARTLPASSVVITIADYVFSRGYRDDYVSAMRYRDDRWAIRSWVVRTILKPGVWGSGLDSLLKSLHDAIAGTQGGFPVSEIETAMARRGKALTFDADLIDDLLDSRYQDQRTYALLSLMYDTIDPQAVFHIDHVFPRALATQRQLVSAGVPRDQVVDVRDAVERLANLQLLRGAVNVAKQKTPPAEWMRTHYPDELSRSDVLAREDIRELPESFAGFMTFYQARRTLMRQRLERLLTDRPLTAPMNDVPHVELAADIDDTATDTGASSPPSRTDALEKMVRRSKNRFDEDVRDLVADGRLHVGEVVHGFHRGTRHQVYVSADGLLVNGQAMAPSSAAAVFTGGSTNGWKFWMTGSGAPIGLLRRR